jgi:hypothetical protein
MDQHPVYLLIEDDNSKLHCVSAPMHLSTEDDKDNQHTWPQPMDRLIELDNGK